MDVKEFKEWLDQWDDDAIVEVMFQHNPPAYAPFGDVVPDVFYGGDDQYEYLDFTSNPYVNEKAPHFNKKILQLGSHT